MAETLVLDTLSDIYGDNSVFNKMAIQLKSFKGKKIKLPIHSGGGSVFEGLAIANILRGQQAHVECNILGLAASMATIIPMYADRVTMADNGYFMIHDPLSGTFGNIEDHEDTLKLLKMIKNDALDAYEKKTGLPRTKLSKMMKNETWMTAKEALEYGFVDEITEGVDLQAKIDLSKYANAPKSVLNAFNQADTNEDGKKAPDDREGHSNNFKESKKMNAEKFMNSLKSLFFKADQEEPSAEQIISNFMEKVTPEMTKIFATEHAKSINEVKNSINDTKTELKTEIAKVDAKFENVVTAEDVKASVKTEVATMESKITSLTTQLEELKAAKEESDKIVASALGRTMPGMSGGVPDLSSFKHKFELKNETVDEKTLMDLLG